MEGRHSDSDRSRGPSPSGRQSLDIVPSFPTSTGMRINNVLNNDSEHLAPSAGSRLLGEKGESSVCSWFHTDTC